ncbi:MAG: peptidylprolyl isomerase [Sediminibacterium sp.]|jgi:peptidyl-prolyl cis-trans isomerase SurA|uniref:peptidylprolyl isomerase n=1 Tax=Sediminibacterium sp. TaxID=1917865 RepID=UPI002AB8ABAC|nr:peptidylprolyl isomerase [Sediminibacterium sp.]MDZ4072723.1 peptidylprolyl isomerase [Sediminibacterium sp.]
MKKVFLIVILLVTGMMSVKAQAKKVVADKIVGQVGDRIILRSDILNEIADMKRQYQGQEGVVFPTECQVLERQLIQKALILQAEKDSLSVTEEEIDATIDNRIRAAIQQYGSKDILEEIAGKTIYQLKEDFRTSFREQKLAEQMQNKIIETIKITPTEVKAYYNKIPKDSLPFYESEVELSQIVIIPKANRDIEEYVSKQMYDYKKSVESGAQKFEALVKLYSEDPGSKDQGGQYNLNRNDRNWDPAFLAASFRLKENQISPVVKSKFGLHIIQLMSRSGDEAVVRHILRIPPVTEDEIKDAVKKLDSVKKQLIAGSLSFGEAVSKYSEDENSKFSAGSISAQDGNVFLSIDMLDKDMVIALKDLKPGEYSAPQVYTDERGRKAVRLIHLKRRTEPHRENLMDDYNRIAQRALESKKTQALDKWFKEHIPTYYISIDKEFNGCESIKEWKSAADKADKERKN